MPVVVAYTFGTLLAAAALVAWAFVWLLVALRVVHRDDFGAGAKVIWLLVILVLPILGLLAYFL
jgi:hypothetical protein